jgi:DNA-directed RNA polymerase I, II, and III subunit RPABC2
MSDQSIGTNADSDNEETDSLSSSDEVIQDVGEEELEIEEIPVTDVAPLSKTKATSQIKTDFDSDEEQNDNLSDDSEIESDESSPEEENKPELNESVMNDVENIYKSVNENDSEEEDYEEYDEDKIDDEIKYKYINSIHHQELYESIDEIKLLTVVKKNSNNVIIDEMHTTYPFLSKYERAKILGTRITQLNNGAKILVETKHGPYIDFNVIAEKELNEKLLPFIIARPLPNGRKEYWRLQDLEII